MITFILFSLILLITIPIVRVSLYLGTLLVKLVVLILFTTFVLFLADLEPWKVAHSQENLIRLYPPIKIESSVPRHGKIFISLNFEKKFSVKSNSKFYQGMIRFRNKNHPISASLINGKWKIKFSGKPTGSKKRKKFFIIKSVNNFLDTSFVAIPQTALSNNYCDQDHQEVYESNDVKKSHATLEKAKLITISAYYDSDFSKKYGSTSNDVILDIINDAEILYNKFLGIRFDVVSQNKLITSSEDHASLLLREFTRSTSQNTEVDLKHLFTGKDLYGSTIGIAYIGAVCRYPTMSTGITQSYGSLSWKIFAHEIGHNLGANHDTSARGNLMYPSIGYSDVYISNNTINSINSYITLYGTCIEDGYIPFNLNNAEIKVSRRKRRIFVSLKSDKGIPISEEMVKLKINKKTYFIKTNSSGIIKKKIRKNRKKNRKRYNITASLIKNSNVSDKLRFNLR